MKFKLIFFLFAWSVCHARVPTATSPDRVAVFDSGSVQVKAIGIDSITVGISDSSAVSGHADNADSAGIVADHSHSQDSVLFLQDSLDARAEALHQHDSLYLRDAEVNTLISDSLDIIRDTLDNKLCLHCKADSSDTADVAGRADVADSAGVSGVADTALSSPVHGVTPNYLPVSNGGAAWLTCSLFIESGGIGLNGVFTSNDNGVSINTTEQSNGGVIINSSPGSRDTTVGAQIEFSIPINTDGSGMWGQGRIVTVADNIANANASGRMLIGPRDYYDKLGTGNSWYYRDQLTLFSGGNSSFGGALSVGGNIDLNGNNVTDMSPSVASGQAVEHDQYLAGIGVKTDTTRFLDTAAVHADTINKYKNHALGSNMNSPSYTHLTAVNHTDLTDGGNTELHIHDLYVDTTTFLDTIADIRDTLAAKEPVIAAGSANEFWSWDKTWRDILVSYVDGLQDSLDARADSIHGPRHLLAGGDPIFDQDVNSSDSVNFTDIWCRSNFYLGLNNVLRSFVVDSGIITSFANYKMWSPAACQLLIASETDGVISSGITLSAIDTNSSVSREWSMLNMGVSSNHDYRLYYGSFDAAHNPNDGDVRFSIDTLGNVDHYGNVDLNSHRVGGALPALTDDQYVTKEQSDDSLDARVDTATFLDTAAAKWPMEWSHKLGIPGTPAGTKGTLIKTDLDQDLTTDFMLQMRCFGGTGGVMLVADISIKAQGSGNPTFPQSGCLVVDRNGGYAPGGVDSVAAYDSLGVVWVWIKMNNIGSQLQQFELYSSDENIQIDSIYANYEKSTTITSYNIGVANAAIAGTPTTNRFAMWGNGAVLGHSAYQYIKTSGLVTDLIYTYFGTEGNTSYTRIDSNGVEIWFENELYYDVDSDSLTHTGSVVAGDSILAGSYIKSEGISAEMHFHDVSKTVSVPTGATYTLLDVWDAALYQTNVIADTTNEYLILTHNGVYTVGFWVSGTFSTNNIEGYAALFKNNVEMDNVHTLQQWTSPSDENDIGKVGKILVTDAPDTIDVRLRHNYGSTRTLTITYGNFYADYYCKVP